MTRLYSFLPQTWNARFARHFHAVIEAYDREFRNRTEGVVPTVEEYLALRRLTFAHWIWTDLLEPSARLRTPGRPYGNTRHIGGRRCSARNSPPGTTTSVRSPRK